MEIEQTSIKKIKFTGLDRLDPVTVFIEDYEVGKGKITFECFGKSWSYYWGGMSGKNVAEFFLSCDVCYLTNCLWDHSMPTHEPDYDGLTIDVRQSVVERRREQLIDKDTARLLYDVSDWSIFAPAHTYDEWKCPTMVDEGDFDDMCFDDREIPDKPTSDYSYLARIIESIRSGFEQIIKEDKLNN